MTNLIDLTGKRIHNLTVLSQSESQYDACGTLRTVWLCKCDCGKQINVIGRYLRRGDTKSCRDCLKVRMKKQKGPQPIYPRVD